MQAFRENQTEWVWNRSSLWNIWVSTTPRSIFVDFQVFDNATNQTCLISLDYFMQEWIIFVHFCWQKYKTIPEIKHIKVWSCFFLENINSFHLIYLIYATLFVLITGSEWNYTASVAIRLKTAVKIHIKEMDTEADFRIRKRLFGISTMRRQVLFCNGKVSQDWMQRNLVAG